MKSYHEKLRIFSAKTQWWGKSFFQWFQAWLCLYSSMCFIFERKTELFTNIRCFARRENGKISLRIVGSLVEIAIKEPVDTERTSVGCRSLIKVEKARVTRKESILWNVWIVKSILSYFHKRAKFDEKILKLGSFKSLDRI